MPYIQVYNAGMEPAEDKLIWEGNIDAQPIMGELITHKDVEYRIFSVSHVISNNYTRIVVRPHRTIADIAEMLKTAGVV